MRGFVGISLFGQDEVWTRLPDKEWRISIPRSSQKYLPAQAAAIKPAPAKKGPAPAPGGAMAPARPPGWRDGAGAVTRASYLPARC